MTVSREHLVVMFKARFGEEPQWVVRAPGRVNLIGEHTDYNDGFVLPLAIDRAVWIALRRRRDRRVVAESVDFHAQAEFSIDELAEEHGRWLECLAHRDRNRSDERAWCEYLKGVAWSLEGAGYRLAGWEGVIHGDVPVGAGLSSSAALEMAAARAFAACSDLAWDPSPMALLAQKAENQWVGVNCGIMDQLISGCGKAGHAVLIDCRTLQTQPVPLPPETVVVVLDTATRRGLVESAYNVRRAQCEAAARTFGVKALRDVDLEEFHRRAAELDAETFRRARHVLTENARTLAAAAALRRGDAQAAGRLMNESHQSLRDDYEVSSEALDAMVEAARAHSACYGARMTGAGFGGCAVALVRADSAGDFTRFTRAEYVRRTGKEPNVYICKATSGAEVT